MCVISFIAWGIFTLLAILGAWCAALLLLNAYLPQGWRPREK